MEFLSTINSPLKSFKYSSHKLLLSVNKIKSSPLITSLAQIFEEQSFEKSR